MIKCTCKNRKASMHVHEVTCALNIAQHEKPSKPQHAPLPWKKSLDGGLSIHAQGMCICLDNMDEAESHPEINEANFDFILRACNSHYELLAALRVARRYIENLGMGPDERGVYKIVTEAIIKGEKTL